MFLVFALAVAVELAWTLAGTDRRRWLVPVCWAAALYTLLRTVGPLADLSVSGELGLLVTGAILLELAALGLARVRPGPFVEPLQWGAAVLPLLGVALAATAGQVPWAGLGAAGAVFAARFVVRSRLPDLAAGLALLDASAVALALHHQWDEPLAFVGPVALSLVALAQALRGTTDPAAVTALRYAAAVAIALTAWVDVLTDPSRTLLALVLALAVMAAGGLLRVRAYLLTGSAFGLAVVATNLVRFGLDHSHFWALYLTLLGLTVLTVMVVSTLYANQIRGWRRHLFTTLADWE